MSNEDPIFWRNSCTPISSQYDDIYFDLENGKAESEHVFLEGNDLTRRFQQEKSLIQIAELGFGTGLNFFTTAKKFLELNSKARLIYATCEKFPLSPKSIRKAVSVWPDLSEISEEFLKRYVRLPNGFLSFEMCDSRIRFQIYFGDVLDFVRSLSGKIDAWYFDGFSPKKNPEMWREEIFKEVSKHSHSKTSFATFSCTGFLKRLMKSMNAKIEKRPGFGRKREMLIGQFAGNPSLQDRFSAQRIGIIGSGVAASQIAKSLKNRGLKAEVFEKKEELADAASGNPLALVMPFISGPDSRALFSTSAFCFQHSRYLSSPFFHPCGVFQSFYPERKAHQLRKSMEKFHWPPELLKFANEDFLNNMEGLFLPRAGILEAKAYLLDFWKNLNWKIRTNSEVASVETKNKSIHLFDKDHNSLGEFDLVFVCNSHSVQDIFPHEFSFLKTNRGQIGFLKTKIPNTKALSFGKYLSPEIAGVQIVGGTYRHEYSDLEFNQEEAKELQDDLSEFFGTPLVMEGGRVGIRCHRQNSWPIGFQKKKGLAFSLGFGSRGFIESALTAESLVSEVFEELLPISSEVKSQLRPETHI